MTDDPPGAKRVAQFVLVASVVQLDNVRGSGAAAGRVGDQPQQTSFDRLELSVLLNLYGRRVAQGEWRDYAMDFHRDRAIFSVYRRASEAPLYRIEKQPRLERRQGKWSVSDASGRVLRRGDDLARVLAAIDRPLKLIAPWDL